MLPASMVVEWVTWVVYPGVYKFFSVSQMFSVLYYFQMYEVKTTLWNAMGGEGLLYWMQ